MQEEIAVRVGSSPVQQVIEAMKAISKQAKSLYTTVWPAAFAEVIATSINCPQRPNGYGIIVRRPLDNHDNIVLTSGGADSTIMWYMSGKRHGIYIDIGQPYAEKERKALLRLDIFYDYIDLRELQESISYWDHIIPCRNLLFLTIAAEFLNPWGKIWFGALEGEGYTSKKGDKSQLFINQFQTWYRNVTGKQVYVATLSEFTKPSCLTWFKSKGHNLDIIRYKTVTCFTAGEGQCGLCQACLRKYLSFAAIGIDIKSDFVHHPMQGAKAYVDNYTAKLAACLGKKDFSHYSERRCEEDLAAIKTALNWMNQKCDSTANNQ